MKKAKKKPSIKYSCKSHRPMIDFHPKKGDCMGSFVNPINKNFQSEANYKIFVDKSLIISALNEIIGSPKKLVCVTRPTRFGKTYVINMLTAYFSKGCDSKELFDKLKISKEPSYLSHLNKHNVIRVDIGSICSIPASEDYIEAIRKTLVGDLINEFPDLNISPKAKLPEIIR